MNTKQSRDYSVDQMAIGFALGAALGLTPLLSVHNLLFLTASIVLRLSLSTFLIGWIGSIPVGFLLDPIFHRLGSALLSSEFLTPLWTRVFNAPLLPLTAFNNTVTLGSLAFWVAVSVPLFFLSRRGVAAYRGGVERLLSDLPMVGAIGRLGVVRRLLGQLRGMYSINLHCDPGLQPFYEALGMQPLGGMAIRDFSAQSGTHAA